MNKCGWDTSTNVVLMIRCGTNEQMWMGSFSKDHNAKVLANAKIQGPTSSCNSPVLHQQPESFQDAQGIFIIYIIIT